MQNFQNFMKLLIKMEINTKDIIYNENDDEYIITCFDNFIKTTIVINKENDMINKIENLCCYKCKSIQNIFERQSSYNICIDCKCNNCNEDKICGFDFCKKCKCKYCDGKKMNGFDMCRECKCSIFTCNNQKICNKNFCQDCGCITCRGSKLFDEITCEDCIGHHKSWSGRHKKCKYESCTLFINNIKTFCASHRCYIDGCQNIINNKYQLLFDKRASKKYLCNNHIKWNTKFHSLLPINFRKSVFTFLLVLNRLKKDIIIPPKFVKYEIFNEMLCI